MEFDREIRARISTSILKKRLANGWSQKVLAEKCGVSQSAIAHIESGRKLPKYYKLCEISVILDIPMGSFFPKTVANSLFRHTIFGQLWLRFSYWWYIRRRNKSDNHESE